MNSTVLLALLGVGAYILYNNYMYPPPIQSVSTNALQASQAANPLYGPSVVAVAAAQQTGDSTKVLSALAPPTGYVPCNPFGPVPYTDCKVYPPYGFYRPNV